MSVPEPLSGLIGGAVLKAGAFSVGLSPTKLGKWENQAGVSRIVQYHSDIIRYIDLFVVLIWNSGKIRVSGMIFCFPLIFWPIMGNIPIQKPRNSGNVATTFWTTSNDMWKNEKPHDSRRSFPGDSLSIWIEHYWFTIWLWLTVRHGKIHHF